LLLHEHHQRGELVVAHRRVGSTKHTRRRLGSHKQLDQKAFVSTKHRWTQKLVEQQREEQLRDSVDQIEYTSMILQAINEFHSDF
jgi:hypothetical protein